MTGSPTSVLITHVHSTQNAGDLALLEMAVSIINTAFDDRFLTVIANWPDEPAYGRIEHSRVLASPFALVKAGQGAPVWRQMLEASRAYWLMRRFALRKSPGLPEGWRELVEAYRAADLVVSVSGNQFYSTGRFGWPFPLTILQAQLAHFFSKPLYVLPQSIGPLRRGWERRMLRSAYQKARVVYLRDESSIRLAREIGLPAERVHYSPDPAFAFPPEGREKAESVLIHHGWDPTRPAIGVTLIAPQGRSLDPQLVDRYYSGMAGLLRRISSEIKAQIFLFSQVTGPTSQEDDRLAVDEVCRRAGAASAQFMVIKDDLSPALLKACYGCMDLFIGSRLHSGIFAMGLGVPVLFVGYLSKTRGMMEALGLANWVVDLANASEQVLWEALRQAWNEREERKRRVQDKLPGLEKSISEIAEWIREDYARINP